MSEPSSLQNADLFRKKYSVEVLAANIHNLSLTAVLQSQDLTPAFCVNYIWRCNDTYAKDDWDEDIYMHDILYWQKHLTENDIHKAYALKPKFKSNQ